MCQNRFIRIFKFQRDRRQKKKRIEIDFQSQSIEEIACACACAYFSRLQAIRQQNNSCMRHSSMRHAEWQRLMSILFFFVFFSMCACGDRLGRFTMNKRNQHIHYYYYYYCLPLERNRNVSVTKWEISCRPWQYMRCSGATIFTQSRSIILLFCKSLVQNIFNSKTRKIRIPESIIRYSYFMRDTLK